MKPERAKSWPQTGRESTDPAQGVL